MTIVQRKRLVRRRLTCVPLMLVAAVCSGAARAETAPQLETSESSCFDQHELGQEQRMQGQLLRSQNSFQLCSASHCPAVVKHDCEQWAREVHDVLPMVTFDVLVNGKSNPDARIIVEDHPSPVASGTRLPLDPGVYSYRVVVGHGSSSPKQLRLHAGDEPRVVSMDFDVARAPTRPIPTLSWVLGGVGVADLASFVGFGWSSRSLESELETRCAPVCSDTDIDRVRQRSLLANISLGIGATSLTSAVAAYLLSDDSTSQETTLSMSVAALPDGGVFGKLNLQAF